MRYARSYDRSRTRRGVKLVAALGALALIGTACGGDDDDVGATDEGTDTATDGDTTDGDTTDGGTDGAAMPGEGTSVTMGRATWDTGWMQAEIYKLLLGELGYDVGEPEENELGAEQFYPALARGDVDFWANGWFPLHDPQLETELPDGSTAADNVTKLGFQVENGALQGYLIDKQTADEEGITSMTAFEDPEVAAIFDTDDNGMADLTGCNDGWGCNTTINEHLENLAWGENVEQVVAQYSVLMSDTINRIESGEPALFYTWTPNWTIDVLTPGEDVVWLESPPLPDDEGQTEADVPGCAAENPCQLGWVANDIRVVANNDFLSENPAAEALFEAVEIPLDDIAAQNAEMNEADTYAESDIEQDAQEWIEANQDQVDQWLQAARDAA